MERREWSPHVTLGYFANEQRGRLAEACVEDWTRRFRERLGGCRLTLLSVGLYGFSDMASCFMLAGVGARATGNQRFLHVFVTNPLPLSGRMREVLLNQKMLRLLGLLAAFAVFAAAEDPADALGMNQIQSLGSHNSYKEAIDPSLWKLLEQEQPGRFKGLEYSHASMTEQLNLGLRKLEIDVVHDPEGGRFAKPFGLEMVAKAGLPAGPAFDPDGMMTKPGLKVLHVPDIDFRTNAYTFQQALGELKSWSKAHPRHLPVVVMMNAKEGGIDRPGFTQCLPFDKTAFDAWDAEIRNVFPLEMLIVPDDVRAGYPTLEAAVQAHAWPTLGWARGRFLFVLDESGPKLEIYADGHPSLEGRVMFVNAEEGRPEAAFRVINSPDKSFQQIQHLVRSGYIVRTRADADTREARTGDYSRLRAALASGAQYISTDYYYPNPDFGTGYKVSLPGGGAGRWNPLLLPTPRPLPELKP